MIPTPAPGADTRAARRARRAWRALHIDAAQAVRLADSALALALQTTDAAGEAWARVALGFHGLYFAAPDEARAKLEQAHRCF